MGKNYREREILIIRTVSKFNENQVSFPDHPLVVGMGPATHQYTKIPEYSICSNTNSQEQVKHSWLHSIGDVKMRYGFNGVRQKGNGGRREGRMSEVERKIER